MIHLPFNIIFIDIHKEFIDELQKLLPSSPHIKYINGDVSLLSRDNTAFVSPANSLGFMDGGIDYVYSRKMFPTIEKHVKWNIKNLNLNTLLGRPYLPIGSSIISKVPNSNESYIISAPTMFLPHNVSGTNNAYHAFMASLMMVSKYKMLNLQSNIDTLVCPALCTGYGKMPIQKAAHQMHKALMDFLTSSVPQEIMYHDKEWCFITKNRDHEQPDCYDNREIKGDVNYLNNN